jgi:hypothetical protein
MLHTRNRGLSTSRSSLNPTHLRPPARAALTVRDGEVDVAEPFDPRGAHAPHLFGWSGDALRMRTRRSVDWQLSASTDSQAAGAGRVVSRLTVG